MSEEKSWITKAWEWITSIFTGSSGSLGDAARGMQRQSNQGSMNGDPGAVQTDPSKDPQPASGDPTKPASPDKPDKEHPPHKKES